MVPPEFGPKKERGPPLEPDNGGEPAGHCLPAAYGRLPSTTARALHRPAPLLGGEVGVLFPVTASYIGVFYHLFPPASRERADFSSFPSGAAGSLALFPQEKGFLCIVF